MNPSHQWPVRPLTPEDVYTDRQEYLDYFYDAALCATERRARSVVLLGRRRMGKTEIFRRVVNRLFREQDHTDPRAAVPVFFTFPDEAVTRENFAIVYVENFVRWYAAFRLQDLRVLKKPEGPSELIRHITDRMDISEGFSIALDLLKAIIAGRGVTLPEMKAVHLPRTVSDWDDTTIVMFLDEFQNTHLPEYDFRIVGFLQEAVESPTCPHFVTGSAMSILVQDILGRGALFGRFSHRPIESLTEYWGSELALRAARYYRIGLPEVMAPVVAARCGGNPFYITSVVQQAAEQGRDITDEDTFSEMLAMDLSSGFIWAELHDQVSRWISKVNEYGITKWILYLAASEEEERIDLTRIQEELRKQQGQEVDIPTIRDVLVKLSRGDLVDYKSFGDWFGNIRDPILNEFLKVWGRCEVRGESRARVSQEAVLKAQRMRKHFDDYKGYLAEIFMVQLLWNSQGKTLPGEYFHSDVDIRLPDRFVYIAQRGRFGTGSGMEVDIHAAAGLDTWLAESKWWARPVGSGVVRQMLDQAALLKEREGDDLRVRLWLFAHNGVSVPAEKLMEEQGVLWSTRSDLDALLKQVGLRALPVLDEE